MVGVYRWKTEGQSEGDLPRDPTLPWLRPRTLLGLPRDPSRLGRVAFTCRAMPHQAATRVTFCVPSECRHFTLRLSHAIRGSSATIGLTRRSSRFSSFYPLCSTIFFYSPSFGSPRFHSVFLHSLYFSLFLSPTFLSLFSSSNFSFSLSRRNSRFPALSKINTSQRGLKTCVNMVLHCLYVHITLSAPGYYYHTKPRRPLRQPSRLFITVQVRGG